ncbi:MAG: excisionase [Actinomycetota bacterium]|nr:excisionase [Actinomycetota bacterium]
MSDELDWERALEAWSAEGTEPEGTWVTLAEAERRAGVSNSALRSWYRSGQVPSRLVDGPHGVQRLVPLDAVVQRAAQSPRIQRRIAGAIGLEAEVAVLRQRVDELETRVRRLEGRD